MPRFRRRRVYRRRRYRGKGKAKAKPYKWWVFKTPKAKVGGSAEIRATARRRTVSNKIYRLPMQMGQLPLRMSCKLGLYHGTIAHAPAAIRGTEVIKMNSIYDPLISMTGTPAIQPTLHDALAGLYEFYKVHGVYIKATIRNTCASPIAVGLLFNDINQTGTFTLDIIRRSASVSAIINRTSDDDDRCTLSTYVPFKSIAGSRMQDAGYGATFGAAPADIIYGYIATASTDGATNVTASIQVEMTFYCLLTNPVMDRSTD